jgi:hypothetical protein
VTASLGDKVVDKLKVVEKDLPDSLSQGGWELGQSKFEKALNFSNKN